MPPIFLFKHGSQGMRKFDEARALFLQAKNALDWNGVALHATEMLQYDESLAWVWANRGDALLQRGFPLDAILNYDRALALEEGSGLHSNKGAAYWEMWNAEKALECYARALELDPSLAPTHMNRGHVYKWQGRYEAAIASYREAVKLAPQYTDAQMALGMMLLKTGQLKEGWEKYELRWKSNQLTPRGLDIPQWRGEDLTGKSILIYGEQGLGDMIQFSRYARVLKKQFPQSLIYIEARQAVQKLLLTIHEVEDVINYGDKVPPVDYAVPMITLGGMLTPTLKDIPARRYEFPLHDIEIFDWADRLELLPKGLRVGICWAGLARPDWPVSLKLDSIRSATLNTFAPLAKVPGITWVSLQKGTPASQAKAPPPDMTIHDLTEDMTDFYETCCVIKNLDLVISVDTAVVHAAASVGVPTWLLSRWDGCWRWFGDRTSSPWYPSLRQFVQPAPHDWDGMMDNVAVELAKLVSHKSEPQLDLTMAK